MWIFLRTYKRYLVAFFWLAAISTSFLWGEGFYAFLDASRLFQPYANFGNMFSFLTTYSTYSFFWFDNGVLGVARDFHEWFAYALQSLFWYSVGTIIKYILFFVFSFTISYKILLFLFNKKHALIWSFFFTFNPISYYFLSQPWFMFVYFGWPLILLWILSFYKHKKLLSILLIYIGTLLLFSYPRLLWIYGAFFVLLGLFFIQDIFLFIKKNYKIVLIAALLYILLLSPILLNLYYSHFIESAYFAWLGNYADIHSSYAPTYYKNVLSRSFFNWFFLKEITTNFQSVLHLDHYYKIFSLLFVFYFIISALFAPKKKKVRPIFFFFLFIYLLIIFIVNLPFFVNSDTFQKVYYTYFPFIANNASWLKPISILALTFFITLSFSSHKHPIIRFINYVYVSLFFLLNITVFYNNPFLKKVSDYPTYYKKFFAPVSWSDIQTSAYPWWEKLYFPRSPYPVYGHGLTPKFQKVFESNVRLVNAKQRKLSFITHPNNRIFNLKNIILFNDIKNPIKKQFPYYAHKDYITRTQKHYQSLIKERDFHLETKNKYISHFTLSGSAAYEYFLYSPNTILQYSINTFTTWHTLNFSQKLINIDPLSFQKPAHMDTFSIPSENKNISVTYKKSHLQPTKIYAKFENLNPQKPFLIQLNQTFSTNWKLKRITKEEFMNKKCINTYRTFPLTQNTYCNYSPKAIDIIDTKYIFHTWIKEKNHFEGNFVGNTWLIEPDNIPHDIEDDNILYAVIIYEKQVRYHWTLILSFVSVVYILVSSYCTRTNQKTT